MRIAIVGAGAIGGLIGARLAAARSSEVSVLARGATLQALNEKGWRLQTAQGLVRAPAKASHSAGELGPQDAVIIAVKATALASVAKDIAPLLGRGTLIIPAMNGVPWWFCDRLPAFQGRPLKSVDPELTLQRLLPPSQVIGCVVHASASSPEPGLSQHRGGQRLILGEPWGGPSERVQAVCDALAQAGFETTLSHEIRREIWFKLWGNLTMNPVSALTGATLDQVLADPLLLEFCTQAMAEAQRIGRRIGCEIEQSPQERHGLTRQLGAVKTSMLQDLEAGRAIELDAIVCAVHEIGLRLGEPMPAIGALLGLTRVLARRLGLYPAAAH